MSQQTSAPTFADLVVQDVLRDRRGREGDDPDGAEALVVQVTAAVLRKVARWGVPLDAFDEDASGAGEFLVRAVLLDRVQVYAMGLGPAPDLRLNSIHSALDSSTDRAAQMWRTERGREVARFFVEEFAPELAMVDDLRHQMCHGQASAADITQAFETLAMLLRRLRRDVYMADIPTPLTVDVRRTGLSGGVREQSAAQR